MIKEVNGIRFDGIENFQCPKCSRENEIDYFYLTTNKAIKAICGSCGAFIKFVKQEVAEEMKEPPTDAQIKMLACLCYKGFAPRSKTRASELINVIMKVGKDYD